MDQNELLLYGIAGLAFLAVAGVGLAFAGNGTSSAAKRAKQLQSQQKNRGARVKTEKNDSRRRQTQQMLESLRDESAARKRSIMPRDIGTRLQQAGLEIPVSTFWIISAVLGVTMAALAYLSGADGLTVSGIEIRSQFAVVVAAGFAGFMGLPRWLLGVLAKGRNKKMTNQFADAIDIIVRGVKSGLPLNECLQIIARESPQPLGGEFRQLSDNIRMGNTIEQALGKFYRRVPLSEVNFFVIVLNIQSKSGGNLSEALGNLSSIIRSRKMMREKIKAMSSEAKASAMIIGSLPFAVGTMVYVTTPGYIMELFIKPTGHMILAMATGLMFVGIMVMRRMINFEI
ncbi:MAG: type II secretion system F family protein [Hyphomonadaceae bacterium]|nr:type II secretion system F family protein [Hyphomonadaceae bacterium]